VLDTRTLVVGISQSGETVDTLQAIREARRWQAKGLVVSNVVDSSMARESDGVLYTRAGPEIGVASTKTHLAQIVALHVLALYLAQLRGTLYPSEIGDRLAAMGALPAQVETALSRDPAVAEVAAGLGGARDLFYLGRHVGYPVALEGALKCKELSYLRAEAYPAGELKHGPIALIEAGTVVVGVATRTRLWEKMMANVAEVRARGATVVLVAGDGDGETARQADAVCWVPRTDPLLAPVLDVIPLQQLAYHLARGRGLDVDRPRNLAKVVTVE
jgi:glucosamine--fructose-6-phosphate aminotransferase (isomerizing)